jgi:Glucosidase II beta subunit-like protein
VANHEYYANGELCSSVHPVIPRTARVSYSCGQAIGVRSVTETSTCAYEIEVSVPSVCGIKEFDQDVGISQAADVHYDRPWMLEIEEVAAAVFVTPMS